MSHFHKKFKTMENPLSDDDIKNINLIIYKTIMCGLKLSAEKVQINYEKLEKQIEELKPAAEPDPFFKAVAEAVAEAGPWNVSMEMVAKKLGLSKSSLYGHFKNKKDMLRRLFETEFSHIIEYARQGINLSNEPAEQLYLGIFSIALYLRSRPEILISMDWIRTRKLDIGKPKKHLEIFRLFEDLNIESMLNKTEDEKQRISHWILFLIINILSHPVEGISEKKINENEIIRLLYKFITLGLGGFIR